MHVPLIFTSIKNVRPAGKNVQSWEINENRNLKLQINHTLQSVYWRWEESDNHLQSLTDFLIDDHITALPQTVIIMVLWSHSVAILLSTYLTVYAKAANPMMTQIFVMALWSGLWSLLPNWFRKSACMSFAVTDWGLLRAARSASARLSSSVLMSWKIQYKDHISNLPTYLLTYINKQQNVPFFWKITLLYYYIKLTVTMSGNSSQNTLSRRLKSKLWPASCLFSYSDDSILPSVGLFSIWQQNLTNFSYWVNILHVCHWHISVTVMLMPLITI